MHLFHRGKIYPIFMKYFFSISISLALIIKLFYFLAFIDSGKIITIYQKSILLYSSKLISIAYAGNQFSYFVRRLGDSRVILLGETKDKNNDLFNIQLKGS